MSFHWYIQSLKYVTLKNLDIFLHNHNAVSTPNNHNAMVSSKAQFIIIFPKLSPTDLSKLESKQVIHITFGFYNS